MSNQPYPPLKLSSEQARETPMVDLAFLVLKAANTPFYYRDLMTEVSKYKGFTEEQTRSVIAQLYTEINVDGRFACVGNNLWGLKRWYPVDNKAEDAMGGGKHPRIINDEEDDEEEEVYAEEEETYAAEEDFDSFDEDQEEVVEEEEEEEFFPEEVVDDAEDVEDDEAVDESLEDEFEEDLEESEEEDSEDDEEDER